MKNINKFFNILSFITLALTSMFLILIFYWRFLPYKTIKFNNIPFPISTFEVERGGILQYQVDYCKYTDLGAEVSKTFINDIIYTTPAIITNRPIGCHVSTITTIIPKELPPSMYKLQIIYRYKVNPMRYIEVITETQKFIVK